MASLPELFDANASIGSPATGQTDLPTVASRLAHMDRLGIARALVWNVEATQHHCLSCNRSLLEEIARTPAAAGRIVPALVVSGLLTYERDGVRQLADQMRQADTRALRFVNVFGRLTLRQCEPVFRELLAMDEFHKRPPFVLLKGTDLPAGEILDFAELFPQIPLVLTEVMWPHAIVIFDLMRRCRNVLLETSWWHTWDAVALAVRHFGADRVVFGTGWASHNGAAIAALAQAGITDDQRALIAHGNLDRLCCTAPRKAKPAPPPPEGKQLWRRCLNVEPLGVDIVDAHGHLGPSAGYVLENQSEACQIPALLADMDRLGVRAIILSGMQAILGSPVEGNRMLRDILRPHAERLLMYAAFNPFYADQLVPQFDEWFADRQVAGFKILCGYWKVPVSDPRFEPMWEYADRHRLPVLMHSWEGQYDAPAMAREVVSRHTDLSLLLGHSGGSDGGRRQAVELAGEFPNVYLEWCGSFCSTIPWEQTLREVPHSRVVYGSDAAAHGFAWEIGRLLSLDVPEADLTAILGANMRRILARRR